MISLTEIDAGIWILTGEPISFVHSPVKTVREILAWEPKRVIVAHGPCVLEDATTFLRRAFAWLT